MDETAKSAITDDLINLIIGINPDITRRNMYGGTVFELQQNDPKTRIGGIFSYEGYVSIEFTNGIGLDDPGGVLEGKGKLRRHIKLHDLCDIEAKGCRGLIAQAFGVGNGSA